MKITMLIYQLYLLYAENLNDYINLFLATENTDLEYVSIFPTSAVIRKKITDPQGLQVDMKVTAF